MKRRHVTLTSAVQSAVLMSCLFGSMKLAAQATGSAALAPMWGRQVLPDFSKLETSPAGDTEAGGKVIDDIDKLMCATQRLPSDPVPRGADPKLCNLKQLPKIKVFRIDTAVKGEAFARLGLNGEKEIYYAKGFENKDLDHADFVGKYVTLAHELSHHLLGHTTRLATIPITQQDELKADQMGACLLTVALQRRFHLGPKKERFFMQYKNFEDYFIKYPKPNEDAVHAKVEVRVEWVISGIRQADAEGTCKDIPPPIPQPR